MRHVDSLFYRRENLMYWKLQILHNALGGGRGLDLFVCLSSVYRWFVSGASRGKHRPQTLPKRSLGLKFGLKALRNTCHFHNLSGELNTSTFVDVHLASSFCSNPPPITYCFCIPAAFGELFFYTNLPSYLF